MGNVRIKIPPVNKKNAVALSVADLTIGYEHNTVAGGINLEVYQGSHVAVLGDNGQGKTTLLRTLAEDLAPRNGSFKWGYGLKVGYYVQHVFAALNPERSVYEYLLGESDSSVTGQDILDFAGSFLFRGDDVKKKISVLSGGERARLCLAGLLLAKNQVLLLDEPTNHLDFETVEALGDALRKFAGTLFFVSHDRTFVNLVTTEIVEVNNGAVKNYMGSYEDYVYQLELNIQQDLKQGAEGSQKTKKKGKSSYQLKKELKTERVKLKALIRKCEETLKLLREEYSLISRDQSAWTHEQNERYEELKTLIAAEEDQWLSLHEKQEVLNRESEKH